MLRNTLRKIPLCAALGLALVGSGLAACAPTVDQRGNLPEPDKLAGIRPGATTKDEVAKILGTPSSTAVFDNKTWYYISRRTKQVAFFDPDVVDQQVYIVNFDERGVVKAADHLLEEGQLPSGGRCRARTGADLPRAGDRQCRPLQQDR